MAVQNAASDKQRQELTGWHVLFMLLGFFGVVFAVNGYFLASALRTHTGVVSVEPYVKGLHYNDRIAAGERQSKLGWQETFEATPEGAMTLRMVDDGGRPVRSLKLSAIVGRPSTNRLDRELAFVETEPGTYLASAGALDRGNWLVSLQATSRDFGDEPVYRMRRRLCMMC